jgi:perosamine synthetase
MHSMYSARIPLCVPYLEGRESEFLTMCIQDGWVSYAGPFVEEFEQAVAKLAGVEHGAAVASGTAALHLALLVTGVQPDEEVIVPSLTFVASANAVRHAGAFPIFVDVEPETGQIDPNSVKHFISETCRHTPRGLVNKETGRRVSAIMPVHLLGNVADVLSIRSITDHFDLFVVEAATEGLGAQDHGQPVGSLGDVACFSFNGNKLITTGGGGMIASNDKNMVDRARYLSTQAKDDPIESIHKTVGFNYRLTNIQAAVGMAQAQQIEYFLARKREIASRYTTSFASLPQLADYSVRRGATSAHWLHTVRLIGSLNPRHLQGHLSSCGIESRMLWQPLHRSPAHLLSYSEPCNNADRLQESSLSLPSSVGLTSDDQARVIESVLDFIDSSDHPTLISAIHASES